MRFFSAAVLTATLVGLSSTVDAFLTPLPASRTHRAPSSLQMSEVATGVTGTVKWYNRERGYGFIAMDSGGADMYVHATGLATDDGAPLMEGDAVRFDTIIDSRTNKPKATECVVVGAEPEVEAEPEVVAEVVAEPEPEPEPEVVAEVVLEPEPEVVAEVVPEPEPEVVAPTPPVEVTAPLQNETFQRSLLAAQLDQARKAALVTNAVKSEVFQRSLLEAQLAQPAPAATTTTAPVEVAAPSQNETFQRSLLAAQLDQARKAALVTNAVKSELFQRSLLEAQLAQPAPATIATPPPSVEKSSDSGFQRSLLEAQLNQARKAAVAANAQKRYQFQRSLLEAALAQPLKPSEGSAATGEMTEEAILAARSNPKSAEEEAALAAKYAAMESWEDRAFAILTDLGMISINSDPEE